MCTSSTKDCRAGVGTLQGENHYFINGQESVQKNEYLYDKNNVHLYWTMCQYRWVGMLFFNKIDSCFTQNLNMKIWKLHISLTK